jgi:hypothetical protein
MNILVADEAWLATALLHREHPEASDFSLHEIRDRAHQEFRDDRPGVWYHIVTHCLAEKPPNPAQYRMLHGTGRGRRRLYRPGDPVHPERRGKIHPERQDLPEKYRSLVDWYLKDYSQGPKQPKGSTDPEGLVELVGMVSAYDLQKMMEAIHEGCERVDPSE